MPVGWIPDNILLRLIEIKGCYVRAIAINNRYWSFRKCEYECFDALIDAHGLIKHTCTRLREACLVDAYKKLEDKGKWVIYSLIRPNVWPIFTFELFSMQNSKESGASNTNTIVAVSLSIKILQPSLNPPISCPGWNSTGLSYSVELNTPIFCVTGSWSDLFVTYDYH